MYGDPLFAPDETQALGGGGLDVDLAQLDLQILGDGLAHGLDVRRHLRCLGSDGAVDVTHLPALFSYQADHVAQQYPAVGALEARIGIGEMLADVAQRRGAQQGIGQSVQQYVAIGVSDRPWWWGMRMPPRVMKSPSPKA